jgi:hypothetical protein
MKGHGMADWKANSEHARARWKDPEFRARAVAGIKATWARRRKKWEEDARLAAEYRALLAAREEKEVTNAAD